MPRISIADEDEAQQNPAGPAIDTKDIAESRAARAREIARAKDYADVLRNGGEVKGAAEYLRIAIARINAGQPRKSYHWTDRRNGSPTRLGVARSAESA